MLRVSGRNLDIGDSLRGQIEERVAAALVRYFDGGFDGHVTVGREGTGFRTDCSIRLDTGITLHATGHAHDAYASFGDAAERIEKRLRRYKRKLRDRPANGAADDFAAPYRILQAPPESPDEDEHEEKAFNPTVVAETTLVLKTLSVSGAVEELDLTGAPFLVFRHGGNERVNVVYRRPDGHIGWIDPQPAGGPPDSRQR